jgi:diaminohydroxyphosphoribosylaminopyrimidine deaminase/5-amino-6-(5-phosphoribosylamino)uracil reductase
LRIIVDSRLRIPADSRILRTAAEFPTLVAATSSVPLKRIDRLKKKRVEVLVVRRNRQGRVSLAALLKELGCRGIQSILLEGGPTLNASAWKEKIVDRVLLFVAPKVIGGRKTPGMMGGEGVEKVKNARRVDILRVQRAGPDLMIEAKPLWG